jgi:hypothetical protein
LPESPVVKMDAKPGFCSGYIYDYELIEGDIQTDRQSLVQNDFGGIVSVTKAETYEKTQVK